MLSGATRDRLTMFGEKTVEPTITVTIQKAFSFYILLIPSADHFGFAQLGDFQVVWMDINITHYFDIWD